MLLKYNANLWPLFPDHNTENALSYGQIQDLKKIVWLLINNGPHLNCYWSILMAFISYSIQTKLSWNVHTWNLIGSLKLFLYDLTTARVTDIRPLLLLKYNANLWPPLLDPSLSSKLGVLPWHTRPCVYPFGTGWASRDWKKDHWLSWLSNIF